MNWLEQIVEHRTPTGRLNKVKIKSLPPKEREKYKPKKQNTQQKQQPTSKTTQIYEEIKKLKQNITPSEKNEKKQNIMNTFKDKYKDQGDNSNTSRYHVLCDKAFQNAKWLHEKIKNASEKEMPELIKNKFIYNGWQNDSTSTEAIITMSLVASLKLSQSEQPIDDEDLINILGDKENFDKMKKGVKDIYDTTQKHFKLRNINQIKLYRGVNNTTYLINRPLESWTLEEKKAKLFGKEVKSEIVDASKILIDLSKGWVDEKELIKITKENNNMTKIALFLRGEKI